MSPHSVVREQFVVVCDVHRVDDLHDDDMRLVPPVLQGLGGDLADGVQRQLLAVCLFEVEPVVRELTQHLQQLLEVVELPVPVDGVLVQRYRDLVLALHVTDRPRVAKQVVRRQVLFHVMHPLLDLVGKNHRVFVGFEHL
ncbi:filamentous hemagglutinin, putative [Babesia ovata]|uniref:Filamentous hemagglutinin, putative n=1 Tax=Babesia ovata TaxID=189622 RepID=A0A2H6KDI3_9APIC|nr:filamentous hemagglutinin, putative [Babesia ovata]GBE61058.1 filamentous hemagglutinin, putative [Babesia ovata]